MIAIASDSQKYAKKVHDKNKLPFDILCDVELKAIRPYGLHHHEPYHDLDVALPANILIDRDGRIVWMKVSTMIQDRMDPGEVLRQVQMLAG